MRGWVALLGDTYVESNHSGDGGDWAGGGDFEGGGDFQRTARPPPAYTR